MISKDDLKSAIELNADLISRHEKNWANQLWQNLKSTWEDIDSRQLYWNILALMSIKTGGGITYNPKKTFDINLEIGSNLLYITRGDFNTSLADIRDVLRRKGIFPEIINRLKILRVQ